MCWFDILSKEYDGEKEGLGEETLIRVEGSMVKWAGPRAMM